MTDRDKAVELLARALCEAHAEDGDHWKQWEDHAAALLAQIAPLLTAVKVKPLVWRDFGKEAERAESLFGLYTAMWGASINGDTVYLTHAGWLKQFDTLEAAKAAAQADYEARILSAVEAVPVAQAIKAERIACTEELRLADAAARAEERVKTLEAVKDAIQCLANPADIPGGCVIPDTFDEGTSAAFEAVGDMLREATAIRKQEP